MLKETAQTTATTAADGRKRRAEAFVPQPEHFDYLELGSEVPPLGKRIAIPLRTTDDLDRVILRVR
jgi:hypothetical protein